MFKATSDQPGVLLDYASAVAEEKEKTQVELDGEILLISDEEGQWEEIEDSSSEEKQHLKKADPKLAKKSRRDFRSHSKTKARSRLQSAVIEVSRKNSTVQRPPLNNPAHVPVSQTQVDVETPTPVTVSPTDTSVSLNGTPLQEVVADGSLIDSIEDSMALHPFLVASSSTPMSRELRGLQHSVSNSKVLSKFVSEVAMEARTSKRRRSTVQFREEKDHSEGSINKRVRKSSSERKRKYAPLVAKSGRSKSVYRKRSATNSEIQKVLHKKWPSDEKLFKRDNMRSQTSGFLEKQNEFLNRVIRGERMSKRYSTDADTENRSSYMESSHQGQLEDEDMPDNSSMMANFSESQLSLVSPSSPMVNEREHSTDAAGHEERLKNMWQPPPKPGWDSFCWKCRQCSDLVGCSTCVRSFHRHCLKVSILNKHDWLCPECVTVENGLNSASRKARRIDFSRDTLNEMLSFSVTRMQQAKQPWPFFLNPGGENDAIYKTYIAHPVTFNSLKAKVEKKLYRCPEEFISDAKWIVHNTLIASASQKEVLSAKAVLKSCRQEVQEIETCRDCYLAANTKPKDWFIDVCSRPHMLVWAKLKGFPFWPAKVMGLGNAATVNVRFFGEHDRAFVRLKDCFLYSEEEPNQPAGKRGSGELAGSREEAAMHIEEIRKKIGGFKFAPNKTPYDPAADVQQLESMMPGVVEYMKRVLAMPSKQSLQYKFVKTAGTYISKMIQKDSNATPSSEVEGAKEDSGVSVTVSPDLTPSKRNPSEAQEAADVPKGKAAPKAKYEVISKITNTNDSTKLVIQKKKSISSEHRRTEEPDSTTQLPAPATEVPPHAGHLAKRKHDSDGNDKHKGKHTKHEHKVPSITIKTFQRWVPEQENEKVVPLVLNSAPTTVETATPTEQAANNGAQHDKSTDAVATIEPDTARLAIQNVVPLIEIKQEPVSDNEENASDKNTDANSRPAADVAGASTAASAVELPQPIIEKDDIPSETQSSEANKSASSPFSVLPIKEEKESDSETDPVYSLGTLASPVQQPIQHASQPAIDAIQMVGQTSIQRIPLKSAVAAATATAPETPKSANANAIATVPHAAAETSAKPVSTPRVGSVPFGPLSAAATAALNSAVDIHDNAAATVVTASSSTLPPPPHSIQTTTAQLQKTPPPTAVGQVESPKNQRARKTFPSSAPLEVGHDGKPVTNGHNFMKTCMISIPADLAHSSSANPPIPVPPLTAVCKPTVAAGVVNTTFATSVPVVSANTNSASNSMSAPPPNANSASYSMSAPPPLAGLSQPSLSPATQPALPQYSDPPVPTLAHITVLSSASMATTGTNTTATAIITPIATATSTSNAASVSNEPIVSTSSLLSTAAAPLCSPVSTTSSNTADIRVLTEVQLNNNPASSATTDQNSTPSELPRLTPRPTSILSSSGSAVFPSQAGPAHMKLVQSAHKLTDFFLLAMNDTMQELAEGDGAPAEAKLLQLNLELERVKKAHETEVADLKRSTELKIAEMRKTMDSERTRIVQEIRQQCEAQRVRAVEDTKKVTWCANCKTEANFYCCWNTSYCDHSCQVRHWPLHRNLCLNNFKSTNATMAGPPKNLPYHGPRDPSTDTSQQQNQSTPPPSNQSQLAQTLQRNQTSTAAQTNQPQLVKKPTMQLNSIPAQIAPVKMVAGIANKPSPPAANKNKNKKEKPTRTNTITAKPITELMKLPSTTYLRPVVSVSNNMPNRPQPGYPMPAQRFNIPLPITTTSQGQHYQIITGAPWNYMGHTTPSTAATAAMNTANNITLHQNQQLLARKFNNGLSIKSTTAPGRNRNGNMASLTFNTTMKNDQQRPQ